MQIVGVDAIFISPRTAGPEMMPVDTGSLAASRMTRPGVAHLFPARDRLPGQGASEPGWATDSRPKLDLRVDGPCLGPEASTVHAGLGPGSIVKVRPKNFLKIYVKPSRWDSASQCHMATKREIFDEEYRVVAVESQSLTIQGVRSGNVLTIVNQAPVALTPADYPPGKLIALSDASNRPAN